MTNRNKNNKRVVKGGQAFTEIKALKAPLGKKEVELGKANRERQLAKLDKDIEQLTERKAALVAMMAEDDKVLAAIESGGDYGG